MLQIFYSETAPDPPVDKKLPKETASTATSVSQSLLSTTTATSGLEPSTSASNDVDDDTDSGKVTKIVGFFDFFYLVSIGFWVINAILWIVLHFLHSMGFKKYRKVFTVILCYKTYLFERQLILLLLS